MSTPNYVVVSLGNIELTTPGIKINGLYKKLASIQLICGFIVLTDIVINGAKKQPIPVQIILDEDDVYHINNVYGYNIIINDDNVVLRLNNSLYEHRITDTGNNYTFVVITNDQSKMQPINYQAFVNLLLDSKYISFYENSGSKKLPMFILDSDIIMITGEPNSIFSTCDDLIFPITDTVTPL